MEIREGSLTAEVDAGLALSLWLGQKGKKLSSWGAQGLPGMKELWGAFVSKEKICCGTAPLPLCFYFK